MRKEKAIQDLQAESEVLQDIIEEMTTIFLQFGDRLGALGLFSTSAPLTSEWKESLEKLLQLAEKAQITTDEYSDEPPSSQAGPSTSAMQPSTPGASEPSSALMPSSYMMDTDEIRSINDISVRIRKLTEQTREHRPSTSAISSPSMTRLFTLNPLMADDYIDPDLLNNNNISFAKRLVRATMIRAYQCLDLERWGHEDNPYKDWFAHSFKYSFTRTGNATLLALTRAVLKSLMTEDEDLLFHGPETGLEYRRLRLACHFNNFGEQRTGLETRQMMTADGIMWENMVDAEQVEDYLTRSGVIWVNEREVQLPVTSPMVPPFTITPEMTHTSTPMETVIATIDIDTLITKLVDTSMCLGNGIGFWIHTVEEAVVSSTVRFE